MKHFRGTPVFMVTCLALASATQGGAQAIPYARSFSQPKAQIEDALGSLQAFTGQKLPILDGFVGPTSKPLGRYERGFYQFSIETLPGINGATIVRLSAKITAWYADRDVAKSGYEVLSSNGRLELDFLDRLQEKLTGKPVDAAATLDPHVDAPRAKLDLSGVPGASVSTPSAAAKTPSEVAELRNQRVMEERRVQQLTEELQNLREIQHHQAHPIDLIVVNKPETLVYSRPSETARVLFQSEANDEFPYLDAEQEGWIHIEISGDARGYIRQNAVLLPERLAGKTSQAEGSRDAKFKGFRMERQESSTFPGDWAPLKSKTVKIYTVQPVSQDRRETGPAARLNFTLALFEEGLNEAAAVSSKPDGVVVIFDAADGGIASATLADIQSYVSGNLTREKFLAQCHLDPIETFREPVK